MRKNPGFIFLVIFSFFCSRDSTRECKLNISLGQGTVEFPLARSLSDFELSDQGFAPHASQTEIGRRFNYRLFENENYRLLFDENERLFSVSVRNSFEGLCFKGKPLKGHDGPALGRLLGLNGISYPLDSGGQSTEFDTNGIDFRFEFSRSNRLASVLISLDLTPDD